MIRFQEQDFVSHIVHTLVRDEFVVPVDADQIELRLLRGDFNTDAVTAAYEILERRHGALRPWASGALRC